MDPQANGTEIHGEDQLPTTQQHPHRIHRLLLLAGTTIGIGLGLALADSDPAHADTTTPTLVEAITTSTLSNKETDRPRPLREITDRLADTAEQTKTLTDKVDKAVEPLPVLGRTVDHVTDTTDRVIDTTADTVRTPIRDLTPKLPRPPTVGDPNPAPAPNRRSADSHPTPQAHDTRTAAGTPSRPEPRPPAPATDATLTGLFERAPTVTPGTRAVPPPAPHRPGPAMVAAAPAPPDWSPDRRRHGTTQQATQQNIDATSPDVRLSIEVSGDLLCDTSRTHASRTARPSPPSG